MIELDPLARMWAEHRLKVLQARIDNYEIRRLAKEIRRQNEELAPLRKLAEERRKAGVRGEGFVMKSCYKGT